ncbi:hypothetical protein [Sorangium sp. So ce341]|uniref:hypothetical protein n=1 Tax=Sorangium sp. So ce341 TaxID=3133302 RepID=UPI003F62EE29
MAHRPWVLTFPWRRRLAQDGASFGVLTRIFVDSVERFYEERLDPLAGAAEAVPFAQA